VISAKVADVIRHPKVNLEVFIKVEHFHTERETGYFILDIYNLLINRQYHVLPNNWNCQPNQDKCCCNQ